MSEILKIRLRPLSKFLFGREKTKGRTDYFLRSHLFPQQTAVLGLLRYEILRRNDLLSFKGINDADEAAKHIGKSSFSGTATQTFGEIEQVSPIELVCGQEVFNLSKNFIKPKAKNSNVSLLRL